MKSSGLLCISVILVFALLAMTTGLAAQSSSKVPKQESRFIGFDVPGAGTGRDSGTFVSGINALGVVAGYYVDASGVSHGFLRGSSGKLTTFDPPGAGGSGTLASNLNLFGTVVGSYTDADFVNHGFVRSPNGTFTTLDAPGVCTGNLFEFCEGTTALDVNFFGVTVGSYLDTDFLSHGFLEFNGTLKPFDAPGAGSVDGSGQGTIPVFENAGINLWGAVTGNYLDANNVNHGFLRSPEGKFTTLDAPGADQTLSFDGTLPVSLNDYGEITGFYFDVNGIGHGFLRSPAGGYSEFDGSSPVGTLITVGASVNNFGSIVGYAADGNFVFHGVLRSHKGNITMFDAPGADQTPGSFNGTILESVNDSGVIAGFYYDANRVAHSFLWIPGAGELARTESNYKAAAPSLTIQGPANRLVHPRFGTVSPMLNRFGGNLRPWYRSLGVQP